MNNDIEIKILKDKTKLTEVYNLRIRAWENSISSNIINGEKYPKGFKDEYDEDSIHLIASNNIQIMSACRVTFFKNTSNFPYINLPNMKNFTDNVFALIGRGVRDKNFHFKNAQYDFVKLALEVCKENGVKYAFGHAYNENIYMQNLMDNFNFKFLSDVNYDNYRDKSIAYPGKLFVVEII